MQRFRSISIFSSQFPKFHVARSLPQFTLHDSPAYKNAQNGYVNERKEGARASGKASCLGVGCGTRHGNQGKAGTSGCSVGGARRQLSPQRSLSFLPSFCRPPEWKQCGCGGYQRQWWHLALMPVLCVLQEHTLHMLTKTRLAPPAVPTRVGPGNKQLAASKKSLMVPQQPVASRCWHQSLRYLDDCTWLLLYGLHFLAPEARRIATPVLKWQ